MRKKTDNQHCVPWRFDDIFIAIVVKNKPDDKLHHSLCTENIKVHKLI